MRTLFGIGWLLATSLAAQAQTSTPQTIKVQGFLNQNGSPANGTFTMTFTLYDAQIPGGNVVTSVGSQSVPVGRGLYEVELPLNASAFTGPDRYLEITVNGEVLTPRMRMASAPFAYVADKLDGLESVDFVKKAGDAMTGSLQVAGTINSTAGGFVFPDGTVQTTASTGSGGGGNTLDQAYDQGGAGAGRTITADAGAVNIGGSDGLTVNGNVGIGTASTSSSSKLTVQSPMANTYAGYFLGNGTIGQSYGLQIDAGTDASDMALHIRRALNGSEYLVVRGDGNTGIGTASPQQKLDVAGNVSLGDGGLNSDFGLYMIRGGGIGNQGQGRIVVRHSSQAPYSGSITIEPYAYNGSAYAYLANAFVVDATGNVGIGTTSSSARLEVAGTTRTTVLEITSDRDAKADIARVNPGDILAKLVALPISTWTYTDGPSTRHIGPMAQDFHAAFAVGSSDKHIATVDADGVALAAVQGLNQVLKEELKRRDAHVRELEARLTALEDAVIAARTASAKQAVDKAQLDQESR